MPFSRTSIQLNVADADHSAAFYAALLGAPATRRDSTGAVFELDSPPLLLTLTRTAPARAASAIRPHARFALVVTEPEHIGHAAIALRRAGVHLRLEDAGIATHDPDGNGWRVRFVPYARERAVLTIAPEGSR
jgi:catechol-2,3-dioxygenase